MVNILARVDAQLAKSEGLTDGQLEAAAVRLLLAEQATFDAAQVAARKPAAADPVSTSTLTSAAAPTDAELYVALEKRAQQEYPSLTTSAAIAKWVLANPDAYTEYRKAETTTRDPELVEEVWESAIGKHISGATADIQLMDMINRYAETHMVTKGRATTEVLKSTEGARLYRIRASGRPVLAERESRQREVRKAEDDWNATVATTRATMPKDTSESTVLEAALHKHGTNAGAAATERQQLIAQLHELALTYQREHPDTTYEASYARVCQQGIGYHISQMLKK